MKGQNAVTSSQNLLLLRLKIRPVELYYISVYPYVALNVMSFCYDAVRRKYVFPMLTASVSMELTE
jgi:hypothetical protein